MKKQAPVLLVAMTLMITVFISFLVLGDRPASDLFLVNLINTCVLEIVFFGYLGFTKFNLGAGSGTIKSILGSYATIYIASSLVVMSVYGFTLNAFIPLAVYVSVLIVLTLVWFIVGYVTVDVDTSNCNNVSTLQKEQQDLSSLTDKIRYLEQVCLSIYRDNQFEFKNESAEATAITSLVRKFNGLTPNVIRNPNSNLELQRILNDCESMLEQYRTLGNIDAEINAKILKFNVESIARIDLIKSRARA